MKRDFFCFRSGLHSPCCSDPLHIQRSPPSSRHRLSGLFCPTVEVSEEGSQSEYEDASEQLPPVGEKVSRDLSGAPVQQREMPSFQEGSLTGTADPGQSQMLSNAEKPHQLHVAPSSVQSDDVASANSPNSTEGDEATHKIEESSGSKSPPQSPPPAKRDTWLHKLFHRK